MVPSCRARRDRACRPERTRRTGRRYFGLPVAAAPGTPTCWPTWCAPTRVSCGRWSGTRRWWRDQGHRARPPEPDLGPAAAAAADAFGAAGSGCCSVKSSIILCSSVRRPSILTMSAATASAGAICPLWTANSVTAGHRRIGRRRDLRRARSPRRSERASPGVCRTAKVEMVRSIGADHVIDYTRDDIFDGAQRYDVILDIGRHHLFGDGRTVARCHRSAAPGSQTET